MPNINNPIAVKAKECRGRKVGWCRARSAVVAMVLISKLKIKQCQ